MAGETCLEFAIIFNSFRQIDQVEKVLEILSEVTKVLSNLTSAKLFTGNSLGGGYGGDSGDAYERRRRARSNDFLDRIDVSVVSTRSAHCTTTASKRKSTPKMSRIEHGLYLGSLDAATDVILLESNAISHIVTVDSVPLPRKITSMMPRIAILHLQVSRGENGESIELLWKLDLFLCLAGILGALKRPNKPQMISM